MGLPRTESPNLGLAPAGVDIFVEFVARVPCSLREQKLQVLLVIESPKHINKP